MSTVENTIQQAIAREYQTLLHRVAQGAAKEVGDIPGGEKLTPADEDARWNYTHPDVTPEQYPQIAAAIADGLARQIQASGQPMPDQEKMTLLVASQMTRVLTKGYRRELVSRQFPMPEEQVKRAEALKRRNEKAAEEAGRPDPLADLPASPVQEGLLPSTPAAPDPNDTEPPTERPAAVRAIAGGY